MLFPTWRSRTVLRLLLRNLKLEASRYFYFILVKVANQQRLKAVFPKFVRKFIGRYVVGAVVKIYDKERRVQRVNSNTILLADYPRCGVAWLRFSLATVLHYRETGEFRKMTHKDLEVYCGTIHGHDKYKPYYFNGGASFLKTHSHYYPEFRRAIMIYRNSYEAIKSMYTKEKYNQKEISHLYTVNYFRGTKREGLRLSGDKVEGLSENESFLVYWSREYVFHHETWLQAIHADPENFLVIKYEDMIENCAGLLPQIISFSGLDHPPLSNKEIKNLATMYTRDYTNWTKPQDLEYRNQKFEELQGIICARELKRLDAQLEYQIEEIHNKLDKIRTSICR